MLPASSRASLSNLSRTGATRATMYIQVTRQQTKKIIHFGLFLTRVLAESQNAQIQVKPDNLNDEGLGWDVLYIF